MTTAATNAQPRATEWTATAKAQIDFLFAEDRAGRPKLLLDHCLPHGMPSWMLITHNAISHRSISR